MTRYATVTSEGSFTGNEAGLGGGIYFRSSSTLMINYTFTSNMALGSGGGVRNFNAYLMTVTNSTFTGNTADQGGDGMHNANNSSPTITNCTLSNNNAFVDAAIHNFRSRNSPTITNCIMWGNTVTKGHPSIGGGTPIVTYSDVEAGFDGTGNIELDLLFVDPKNDDYHLSPSSPSIDAGNNWGVLMDATDFDLDNITCELFPVDMDGNPRFNADEADFDPGCGIPVVVDMGAYKYQFDPVDQITFADLNGDGAVSTVDLLSLLSEWGTCDGCCLADYNIDGSVGTSDLLELFAQWGTAGSADFDDSGTVDTADLLILFANWGPCL